MTRTGLIAAGLAVVLCSTSSAVEWTELNELDGYRSQQGTITAKSQPQPARKVLQTALAFEGLPYVWAGASPASGFDCSGYIYEVMRLNGYEVPRMADYQFYESERVEREDLEPGDMVFFTTYLEGPSHVGFYLGSGKFIHASSAGEAVVISQMNTGYYNERFLGGGRPANWVISPADMAEPTEPPVADLADDAEPTSLKRVVVEPQSIAVKSLTTVRDPFAKNLDVTMAPPERTPREAAAKALRLTLGELVSLARIEVEQFYETAMRSFSLEKSASQTSSRNEGQGQP